VLREAQSQGCPVDVDTASPDEFEDLGTDPKAPKGSEFNIRSHSDFAKQVRSVQWIVKEFLPQASLGVLFGESGSGKSFLAYDLSAAVSRGIEWNGRKVTQGRVLYIVAEGVAGFVNRIKAYCHQQAISPDDINIDVISDVTPNLLDKDQVSRLVKAISAQEAYSLIVVDTFAQVTPGANENSGEDMGKALAECRRIHRASGAMVLLVHHSGKDASKGARGWSGLRAAADVELEVLRSDEVRSVSVTKLKDGQDGGSVGFKLHTVVLGEDEDGDDITSCIVEYNGQGKVKKGKEATVGKLGMKILGILHDLSGLEMEGKVLESRLLDEIVSQTVDANRNTKTNAKKAIGVLADKKRVILADGYVILEENNEKDDA
jgi:archaellum biogenesis ATPase FlaH